ncbi:helicase, partial [Enterococcus hirae]
HAKREFWRWVSSWGALVRSPADLGFDASRYDLPKLTVEQHTIYTEQEAPQGMLFALEAQTLMERRNARRNSVEARVEAC